VTCLSRPQLEQTDLGDKRVDQQSRPSSIELNSSSWQWTFIMVPSGRKQPTLEPTGSSVADRPRQCRTSVPPCLLLTLTYTLLQHLSAVEVSHRDTLHNRTTGMRPNHRNYSLNRRPISVLLCDRSCEKLGLSSSRWDGNAQVTARRITHSNFNLARRIAC